MTGRGVRRTLGMLKQGGGAALGAIAIFGIVSESHAAADAAVSYGHHLQNGDNAFADLDAIDIAVNIQNAGGNYFVTMYALDLLLTE